MSHRNDSVVAVKDEDYASSRSDEDVPPASSYLDGKHGKVFSLRDVTPRPGCLFRFKGSAWKQSKNGANRSVCVFVNEDTNSSSPEYKNVYYTRVQSINGPCPFDLDELVVSYRASESSNNYCPFKTEDGGMNPYHDFLGLPPPPKADSASDQAKEDDREESVAERDTIEKASSTKRILSPERPDSPKYDDVEGAGHHGPSAVFYPKEDLIGATVRGSSRPNVLAKERKNDQ
jgi:hypothetical protein